jgi:hypothetical protein
MPDLIVMESAYLFYDKLCVFYSSYKEYITILFMWTFEDWLLGELQFALYGLPHNNSVLKAIKMAWNWVQEHRNFKRK